MDEEKIKKGITFILLGLGENLKSQHLKRTPERIAKLYSKLFIGYGPEPEITKFKNDKKIIGIQVRKCDFLSYCPHHIAPYAGVVYVAYIPDKYLIGMDKIDLIVDYFAGRLTLQEYLCHDVADFLMKCFTPKGVYVQVYGIHYCALCKGNDGSFGSSAVRGVFKSYSELEPKAVAMFHRLDMFEGKTR